MNGKCYYTVLFKSLRNIALAVFLFFAPEIKSQQYNVAGSAVALPQPGCYRITGTRSDAGAIWNIHRINLTQRFDITLTLNFGDRPGIYWDNGVRCGGDGMSVIFQPLNANTTSNGEGVGFHGISPSLGIVMDSYFYNPTDPEYQHISIHKNGDELHGTSNELTSYTAASGFPSNISDGADHLFRLTWEPSLNGVGTLKVYFGNATTLPSSPTISYTGDIVNGIFSGNPEVFWGISGSTGDCWNIQTVCITTVACYSSDTLICQGTPCQFTSTSSSGLPIVSWLWHFGDGDSSNVENPTHIYAQPGTYTVDLTVFNSGGFFSSTSNNITVRPRPVISITGTPNTICLGSASVLTATGAQSYTWANGLGYGNSITVSPLVTTVYSVSGTLNGCMGFSSDTLLVNPLPQLTLQPSDTTICAGDSVILSVFSDQPNTAFLWNNSSAASSIKVGPALTTTYVVTGESNHCMETVSMTVNVLPLPSIMLRSSKNPLCTGDTTLLSVYSVTPSTTYTWPDGSTGEYMITSPGQTAFYYVTATSGLCTDTASIQIRVVPEQYVTLGPDRVLCEGDEVVLNALNVQGDCYWSTGIYSNSIRVTEPGTYWLLVDHEGCISSDTILIEPCFNIWVPNAFTPNKDHINDTFKPSISESNDYKMLIYNRWGEKLFECDETSPGWDGTLKGNDVPQGVYYYIIHYTYMTNTGMEISKNKWGSVTLLR